MTSPIRVLALDDSATIRETIGLLPDGQPDMDLVGRRPGPGGGAARR